MPDASAACTGGVAYSCPSGVLEQIDCTALLKTDGCTSMPLSSPFDWTSACMVSPPTCTADSCLDASTLLACERGTTFSVDCAEAGLGPCRMVATDVGSAMHAACSPP
jgi:hypothetical protein